jgi:hypothetical protein
VKQSATDVLNEISLALPDLGLVLGPFIFYCLPVTRIWPLLFLHYRDNAKLKWQFLLVEVPHSAERWIAVHRVMALEMFA